jgi:hypothetical protein
MSRNNPRGQGSRYGQYVDGIAAVLTKAMQRLGREEGSSAVLTASRPLSGPDDGGAPEIACGERASWPPTVSVLELNDEERQVTQKILAESLKDPAFETWSDLVVAIKLHRGGTAVAAMPRPVSALSDPAEVRRRNEYLRMPVLQRLQGLMSMADNIR